MEELLNHIGSVILAVGALGTASFGIVEGLKWTPIGTLGFNQIWKFLDEPIMNALEVAYGKDFRTLLKEQYRSGRTKGELLTSIRQGVRIGLTPDTAGKLASRVCVVESGHLVAVAEDLSSGKELVQEKRSILGRYELAVDALITASLARANAKYVGGVRVLASAISILIALAVGKWLYGDAENNLLISLFVGVAAVPVAPIAKDLSTAVRSVGDAMKKRGS